MIRIIAVGKVVGSLRQAVDEYSKRLSLYSKVETIELKEYKLKSESASDIAYTIREEGNAIVNKIKGYSIALDSKGQEINSEELAQSLKDLMNQGNSDITFIIGGSYGLSEEVIRRADKVLSFGRITYPHQLMRVILLEQLYRAFSIINNSKYHK